MVTLPYTVTSIKPQCIARFVRSVQSKVKLEWHFFVKTLTLRALGENT